MILHLVLGPLFILYNVLLITGLFTMQFSPWLLARVLGYGLEFGILGLISGIGLLKDKAWGWRVGAFLYTLFVIEAIYRIYGYIRMTLDIGVAPNIDQLVHSIIIGALGLIILSMLFKRQVLACFNLLNTSPIKILFIYTFISIAIIIGKVSLWRIANSFFN